MHPWPSILPTCIVLLIFILVRFIYTTLWIPYKILRHFKRQGIKGPGYRPIYGNSLEFEQEFNWTYNNPMGEESSHDIVHRLDPCYHKWSSMYGKTMLFWHGSTPRLAIAAPEMLKDVFLNKSGLAIKSWIPEVVNSVEKVLQKWEDGTRETNEIEVDVLEEFRFLSAEILSKTGFGSNFEEGKHIHELIDQQAELTMQALRSVYIPGSR
ncbi:OLC1v1024013C1 [Oldenlandia corymbosa var. corymbosa]|uniref:OLC1v1024013C1 n=1 Tax=Oldenlandia corymbosa var. corymbosa TaxID=529605 RepID=A0AAV1C1B1_OLDCO|nr:OLC1v1024013C1 [Oldenlandia corymbosa var. corymbosa]